ncbi:SDR family oxidoreductase [Actinomadura sp. B10D3]|uniref:SDR family NAD(P)-dependent oxidoreductase n=1 Tax=Actinomadura sp. B10D3 TaxID=3153557 RepID=UPI00325DE27C
MSALVVIVTGASRGIGRQIALDLARRGHRLVLAARTMEPSGDRPGSLSETVRDAEAAGAHAIGVQADLARAEDASRLVERAVEEFGGVDAVVNNAAATGSGGRTLEEMSWEDWARQFDTNVHGTFAMMRAATPHLVARRGGTIVNLSSRAGDLSDDLEGSRLFSPAYAASKAAINRLGNVVAAELRDKNVAVVALDPGSVRTERVAGLKDLSPEHQVRLVEMTVPSRAVVRLVTGGDSLRWTGQLVRAKEFVDRLDLLPG